jgi:hypothetical protein
MPPKMCRHRCLDLLFHYRLMHFDCLHRHQIHRFVRLPVLTDMYRHHHHR